MPEQHDVETFRPPSILSGANEMEKLKALSAFPYKYQAQWVLNARWQSTFEGNKEESERMWEFTAKFVDLDLNGGSRRGASGCELDEFGAHRFLEAFEETLTVRAMREKLREIDIDSNKSVSLVEYLIFRYSLDWKKLVNAAQSDNAEEIEAAQTAVKSALAALTDAQEKRKVASAAETAAVKAEKIAKEAEAEAVARDEAAKVAAETAVREENEAVAAETAAVAASNAARAADDAAQDAKVKAAATEAAAVTAEADAKEAEAKVQAAEDEVRATLAILEAEQSAYDKRTETLKSRITDSSLGVVSRGRAKNELAQHLEKVTLPLQRARITQQAATRKMEKVTKAAKIITEKAAAERQVAEKNAAAAAAAAEAATAARQSAEADAAAAEAARAKAEKEREEATAAREAATAAADAASAARAIAEERRAEAVAAREAAEASRAAAVAASEAAAAALEHAQTEFAAAEEKLNDLKKNPGTAAGSLWWMDRELYEARKYLPAKKGGIVG